MFYDCFKLLYVHTTVSYNYDDCSESKDIYISDRTLKLTLRNILGDDKAKCINETVCFMVYYDYIKNASETLNDLVDNLIHELSNCKYDLEKIIEIIINDHIENSDDIKSTKDMVDGTII